MSMNEREKVRLMRLKESCWILKAIVGACKKVPKVRKKRKKGLAET